MEPLNDRAALLDVAVSPSNFARDVLRGLSRSPKRLPSKYFYDARGSQLFDEICLVEEYYPTRTELQVMDESADQMADMIGSNTVLIEYGSGSSLKTRLLLDALQDPVAYVPVDISHDHLDQAADAIREDYPSLVVHPIAADFTRDFDLPDELADINRRSVYFPGSTIGNFTPRQALKLLRRIRRQCGEAGGLLLGVDLVKDRDVLRAAYNDKAGVTAAFNLNLLERINRELGGDFDVSDFEHLAVWNESKSRIEMHLRSRRDQTVQIGSERIDFALGETICTEYSHKYTQDQLIQMADRSGFDVRQLWTDPRRWFGVAFLSSQ